MTNNIAKASSELAAGIAAVADDLEDILQYCRPVPKEEEEQFKRQIYYKAKLFGGASSIYARVSKKPTNAQRKKRLREVAEHANALNRALRRLTADNHLLDLIKIKANMRKRRSETEQPFKWRLTSLFGGKLDSFGEAFNVDLSQDTATRAAELEKAFKEGKIPALNFIYKTTGIYELLSHLAKAATRQEKRIKSKGGGPRKTSFKLGFAEDCEELFEEISSYPITTTSVGPFREFIEIMHRLAFGTEAKLEKEVRAIVKRRTNAAKGQNSPISG